jgi:hypothetical protein
VLAPVLGGLGIVITPEFENVVTTVFVAPRVIVNVTVPRFVGPS